MRLLDTRLGRSLAFLLLAAPMLAAPRAAHAQSDEQRAAARSLATDGAAAFKEGRYQDAIDMLGRAESLVHAPTHLLFIARAEEKLGRLVKAREAYLKITKEQIPAGAPPAFRDAQTQADQELRAIEPRLASLQVTVTGADAAKDLVVLVNGQAIPDVLVGVPRPVDPGEYQVEAVGTGWRAPAQTVSLGEGQRKAITLEVAADSNAVPPGGAAAPTEPAPAAATPAPTSSTSATLDTSSGGGSSGLRIASFVALGVGVVGAGLGTYFLIDSGAKRSDADDKEKECIAASAGGQCSESSPLASQITSLDKKANDAQTLALVGFVVGGVGLATGAVLFFMSAGGSSSDGPPAASGLSVQPWVGLGSAGLSGRF